VTTSRPLTTLPLLAATDFPPLRRQRLDTLQVKLGYKASRAACTARWLPARTSALWCTQRERWACA